MIQIGTRLTGNLEGDLAKFSADIKGKVLFSGAATMAKVIYEEVKLNVARLGTKSGNLQKSIYRVYSPERSSDDRKTYRVSWNHRTAPHGHLLEYGYFQRYQVVVAKDGSWITLKNRPIAPKFVPAHPFIRPAFDHVNAAIAAGLARMSERVKEEAAA